MIAVLLLLVVGIMAMSGCAGNAVETITSQIIEDVSAQEASDVIQQNQGNPDFTIVDVRSPEEFADGHIENAINIDINSGIFRSEIDKLDKDKKYLVYCRSGNRSQRAIDIMTELGFMKIYHVTEGIVGWEAAGFMTVR